MSTEPWVIERLREHDLAIDVLKSEVLTLRVTVRNLWVALPTVFSLIGLVVLLLRT